MMTHVPSVDLRPDHWAIVRSALRRHVPDREVLAFGSRATWTAKDYSDLDLAVMGEEPLSLRTVSALDEALGDSDLPFKVDVVDWARIDEGFRAIIRRHGVAVQGCTGSAPGWPRTLLGNLVSVHREQVTPSSFPDRLFAHHSIPAYDDGQSPVVESGSEIKSNKFTVPSDAVLVSRLNPRFARVWVPEVCDDLPAICSTEFLVLRPSPIDRRFLHQLCLSPGFRTSLLERVTGTSGSHQRVAPDAVLEIDVAVPTLPEQRAIAHILGTLDDKIELNRRMSETLEAMARALFKSWFVDFDPVRAKLEGRDTGLPRDIADLFPDRLVDSEMGAIPEGWEVFRLDRLADHHTKSTSPLRSPEEEYEHFSIPAYDAGQRPSIELGETIRSNKTVVRGDAVLLSKLNPRIPRVWMPADSKERPQVCSTEFLVFTPRPPANRSLLFALFADQRFRALLKSMVTGTSKSHQRVPPKALKTQEVLAGSPRVFRVFGEAVGSLLARSLRNRSEVTTLAALRDTLLPKLIAGEIRTSASARKPRAVGCSAVDTRP